MAEFRIIDPPRVSPKPVFPNRLALAPLALFVALGAGFAVCFLLSQAFPTIHSSRLLRQLSSRPVLGSISTRPTPAMLRRSRWMHGAFAGGVATLVAVYGGWVGWMAVSTAG